jgi:hypothetical protein
MKSNTILFGAFTLMLAGSLLFGGCRKRETKQSEEPDKEANTARDNATAENIANDIMAIGSQAVENGTLTEFRVSGENGISLAPCATISVSGAVITVDFGTSGCIGQDGRKRTGKLFFNLSAASPTTAIKYRNPGFNMIVTSQNYVVDSNLVAINGKTITNTTSQAIGSGPSPTINLTWNVKSNITITKPNGGGTISWNCDRTKELINTNDPNCYKGQTLPIDWSKAKVKLNGNASGTNARGESFTAKAIDLVRDFTCSPSTIYPKRHPFVSGKIEYKPGNRPIRYIDYGNGGCDLNATVVINGVTYSITLP